MPRFVILEHDHPFLHCDLMLEGEGVLFTWRLDALPEVGKTLAAERIGDHRMMYLDYEGPVSGGRGSVRRVEGGTFSWVSDPAELNDLCHVQLNGNRLSGLLRLDRGDEMRWSATLTNG
jgi:hypothetical protein